MDDIKAYRAVEVQLHTLLTAVLDEGEWSASRSDHFTPGGEPPYSLNMWPMGPSARLDT